jgi:hypothetical protein
MTNKKPSAFDFRLYDGTRLGDLKIVDIPRYIEHLEMVTTHLKVAAEMKRRSELKLPLLDLIMPNGKLIRDCTGPEMAEFNEQMVRIVKEMERRDKKVTKDLERATRSANRARP